MSVSTTQQGNVCVLRVDVELTGASVEQFHNLVRRTLSEDGRDFAVDFTGTTRIDSAGLEALTWLKRECEEQLGMVKLCNLSGPLKQILEMTRLDLEFEQYEHVEETVESFA